MSSICPVAVPGNGVLALDNTKPERAGSVLVQTSCEC